MSESDDAESLFQLGHIQRESRDIAAAVASYRATLCLAPGASKYWTNFGNALSMAGSAEAGYKACARALLVQPDFAFAHFNLGLSLAQLRQPRQALLALRAAAALGPGMPRVHANLGGLLRDLGRPAEAISASRIAITIASGLPEAHFNLGVVLNDLKRSEEALSAYDRTVELRPDMPGIHSNRASVLSDLGRYDEGARACRIAICLDPAEAPAYSNLATMAFSLGKLPDAVRAADRALKIADDFAAAHFNRANALYDMGRLREAYAGHRTAVCVQPSFDFACSNLATALQDLGRIEEATTMFGRALILSPDFPEAKGGLLFLLASREDIPQSDYLARAQELQAPPPISAPTDRPIFALPRSSERRLRVGYVSGDFRKHSISYFIEQIFAHHDRRRIEVVAYSTSSREDAVTAKLRSFTDRWVSLDGLSDETARDRIIEDGIDVLIDLSGHTRHNRLGVFASRAAPVQAHYLGFFASTGVPQMDYWIADGALVPPAQDANFCETVWRLPRTWVSYHAREEAPAPSWRRDETETIWLGSFNNLYKLNDRTLDLWARVLLAMPEARLLLKSIPLSDQENRTRLLDRFAGRGVGPERLDLRNNTDTPDWTSHMAYYDRLDIALDPIGGVGGGTTTCDALWMGVPVVGLEGDRMATRMTLSMLHSIGRPGWIARDEQGYIDKVAELAGAVEFRRAVRREQRQRMADSPLCDAAGLARSLEDAYEEMLRRALA